ncbi:hypothetical protein TNCV_3256861 [Trichonephila clavipes]|nr:hypothetical protein TNCV_3256861 [Trichonephila clavipes]
MKIMIEYWVANIETLRSTGLRQRLLAMPFVFGISGSEEKPFRSRQIQQRRSSPYKLLSRQQYKERQEQSRKTIPRPSKKAVVTEERPVRFTYESNQKDQVLMPNGSDNSPRKGKEIQCVQDP